MKEPRRLVALLEALTPTALQGGHEVDLLCDGATYSRLWRDLSAAERSITLQLYFVRPGSMADELQRILVERARSGVRVLLLYDSIGAWPVPVAYFDALRKAGAECRPLRPVGLGSLAAARHRWHGRAVVVDGRVGYTGGFGIADDWFGDGRSPGQWRETNVRFAGPAVRRLQGAFAAAWAEADGTLLADADLFPFAHDPPADRPVQAALLHTRPEPGSTAAERFLSVLFSGARRRLWVSSGYFAPDAMMVRLLRDAVERGVDVRVLTASEKTDLPAVRWAGRSRYERLLRSGVRIWEYRPTMMHAKTMVVDAEWCVVGAHNLDARSARLNEEISLLAYDPELGARMERLFQDDLGHAREIRLDRFRRRDLHERLLERAAALIYRLV